jgi:large repetitive protein
MSRQPSDHPKADSSKRVSLPKKALDKAISKTRSPMKFGSQLLAIEQRMLFDGALGVTVDALRPETKYSKDTTEQIAEKTLASGGLAGPSAVNPAGLDLVVIDSGVANWQQIASAANTNAQLLILDPAKDGLSQIAQAMAGGRFASVHIVSHGTEGRLLLGTRAISASNIDAYAADLQTIGQSLGDSGDMLLYGCDIGNGAAGASFLQALARATHADIAASTNDTGGTAAGGDWVLESSTGVIEAGAAFNAGLVASYDGLLVAQPTVTISAARTATGDANKVLLGEDFSMTATFDNTHPTDTGYGPYIDLFYSANGADGGDGLQFDPAKTTYLGIPLVVQEITLTAANIAAGNVTHPYFNDGTGSPGANKVSIPGGYVAGDKLMVIELPFGSFTAGQPAVAINLGGKLSSLADLSSGPSLNVSARAGFRYGGDALDNAATDPTLQQSGALSSQTITPELYRVRTTYIGPENETATGENYKRAYRIDVDVAQGHTLTNLQLQDVLPNTLQFVPIAGTNTVFTGVDAGTSPSGAWTNVNGVLVSTAATGTSGPSIPGGTVTRNLTAVAGTSQAIDASMIVQFYVPEFDAAAALVLDAASGDDRQITNGVQATPGGWTKIAGANDASTAPVIVDTKVPVITAQSISTQKSRVITTNVGLASISPGDLITYTIDSQISDYFAVGGATTPSGGVSGSQKLEFIDVMSDGLEFETAFAPLLTVNRADGTASTLPALILNTDYTVATNNTTTGQQTITVDLRGALQRAGLSDVLIGDQFGGDNSQTSAMTVKLVFQARVLDAYRVGASDDEGDPSAVSSANNSLNEGDRLVNRETLSGTILDSALNPNQAGLLGEIDNSSVRDRLVVNAIDIALTSVNSNAVVTALPDVTPGDNVTYRVRYTVPTGDFENFKMSAFVPQPVYSIADPDADSDTPNVTTFSASGVSAFGDPNPTPAAGSYSYRVIDSDGVDVTAITPILSATVDSLSNGITFDFGDRSATNNKAISIEVFFTVETNSLPFADGLKLTASSQSEGQTTSLQPTTSQSIVQFNLTEPVLKIYKAAVQDDVAGSTIFNRSFTATDPSSFFSAAGSASANPLSGGTLTSADIAAAGNFTNTLGNVDSGDTVRYAIVVENTGSSACGAYDIKIRDTLPAGVNVSDIVPGSLKIVRGDGVVLVAGTDYIGDINALFGASGIEFVDVPDVAHGGVLGAARGVAADGTVIHGLAGANVLVVTYDVKLPSTVAGASVLAGSRYESSAQVFNYAGSDGLNTTLNPNFNHALTPLSDSAEIDTPAPAIAKLIVSSSESYTAGSDVVIGEIVTYSVTISVPEGRSGNTRFVDSLDPGLAFVDVVSISSTPGIVLASSTTTFDAAARNLSINFGTVENIGGNTNGADETITVMYRAVATNVAVNQSGVAQNNTATATVSDRLGNNASQQSYSSVTIVEPVLTLDKTASTTAVQVGETVKYTITITNTGTVRAHDVNLNDLVPAGMTFSGFVGSPQGLTQTGGAISGVNLSGSALGYLDPGETFTFMYEATVNSSASLGQVFDTTANIDWSSLPGTSNGDRTPLITGTDNERSGNGGVNDYTDSGNAPVTVLGTTAALTIVQTSESATGPGSAMLPAPSNPGNAENVNVAPGEIVRYRMIVQMPEVNAPNARFNVTLPPGIRFLNDNTSAIGFVADGASGGINSDQISGGDLTGGGLNAGSISSLAPTRLIANSQISGGAGSGDDVSFDLGNLVNTDSDANGEFIVIEFNAVVDNADAAVVRNATLPASFAFVSNAITQTSDTDLVRVVEPAITDLTKTLTSVAGSVATFTNTFSNTGNSIADSVRVVDSFVGYPNITFGSISSVLINGVAAAYTSNPSGLDLTLTSPLQVGDVVTVTYTGNITDINLPVPTQDAVVTYSSLTSSGSSMRVPGVGTSNTPGDRTGITTDYGTSLNTYRDVDGAGVGVISGRLWDDTPAYGGSPSDTFVAGERALGGVTLKLLNASDVEIATAVTNPDGTYRFTGLAAGTYKVQAATALTDTGAGNSGDVRARFDADGGTLGTINVSLAEGGNITNRDIAYVQLNEAPVVNKPADKTINEDQILRFDGGTGANSAGLITVGDEIQNTTTTNMASLSVTRGTLALATGFSLPAGAVVTGTGTAAMMVTGSIANINTVLSALQYTPNRDYFGSDALTVRIEDKGAFGDANSDGLPHDLVLDNLSDTKVINLTVNPVNDAPMARPDDQTVVGGAPPTTGNALTGLGNQPGGQTAAQDSDVDSPISIISVANVLSGSDSITAGTPGSLVGDYGTLVLQSNGDYVYTQDPVKVGSLNLAAGAVRDEFTYTISDGVAGPVSTTITIRIGPVNANPVAQPDFNVTVEGATSAAIGNAITGAGSLNNLFTAPNVAGAKDNDPTTGAVLSIQGVIDGTVGATTHLTTGIGQPIIGQFGTLTIDANGNYSYQVDNTNASVIALSSSTTTIQDEFTYTVSDGQGGVDNAVITINISGINNRPMAIDDVRTISANAPITDGQTISGNGLGDVADIDPDAADSGNLSICGVVQGTSSLVGNSGVGAVIEGIYGDLILQADGSYTYTPTANAQAIPAGQTRSDYFSYCLQDPAGLNDVGLITITLNGVNDAPIANPEFFQLNKSSPPQIGNAITGLLPGEQKDTDPDGDSLTVLGVNKGPLVGPLNSGVGGNIGGDYGNLVLQPDGRYTYTLDPAKTASIAKTDNVTDVFTYTIRDTGGETSTTTITFKITGENQAPAGTDKFVPVVEDTPYKITAADFGFTDPDTGDTFKAVRITSLPEAAAGKLFYNGSEVVLPAVGYITVNFADINKLEFRPAPNANTANLAQAPSIRFQVCDNDGALDPTPNKLSFSIAPANDPPVATQSVYVIDAASRTCALDPLPLVSGTKPGVTDADLPADTLTVAINAVPDASQGQYFVGSSAVPLKAGDTLTPAQLQQLCFKPGANVTGTRLPDGTIATSPLRFTVSDGKGGVDTSGSVQINVKPLPAPVPTTPPRPIALPPTTPIVAAPFLPPITRGAIVGASALRAADDIRFSPIEASSDLDADGFFDSGRIKSVWNRERVAGVQVVEQEKPAPMVKPVEDCEPAKPKEKPKLKAVKRSVFADNVKDVTNKNFTEQLKSAQKRFKPPTKLMPKPQLSKEC